jgi:hypothetical protein
VLLQFFAQPQKSYTIEYRANVDSGAWLRLADIPAEPTGHWVFVPDSSTVGTRFYRVRTPVAP